MAKRILKGLQRAARVVCDSGAVREALIDRNIIKPERIITVPLGVDSGFSPKDDDASDAELLKFLGPAHASAFRLLHVGSTIPRKRVDTLLCTLAKVRATLPQVVLAKIGGAFTREQEAMIRDLGLSQHIIVLPFITRRLLAAAYRWADLVLQPSESEGFGLPVIEAMACGTPVVASNLRVLREVGGDVAIYCPVGDTHAWSNTIVRLLELAGANDRARLKLREACVEHASRFTWCDYADRMVDVYSQVLSSVRQPAQITPP
jgi:glycosyltransferase involved in cell wall biosynthesis